MTHFTPCSSCRFDPADWTGQDLAGTLRAAEPWWDLLVGRNHETADLVTDQRARLDAALAIAADDPMSAVHEITCALRDAGRVLHKNGIPPTTGEGRVEGLFVSNGGVPKLPIDHAEVGLRGLAGDRQHSRKHHGRPWQALCLWSVEVIHRLAAEGHLIAPGRAGENVTISGLDWTAMRPGVRLAIGGVLAETTPWTLPCRKNAAWFTGGDFDRMHHERERGVSRIYAWVLEPGTIRLGDPVTVEP